MSQIYKSWDFLASISHKPISYNNNDEDTIYRVYIVSVSLKSPNIEDKQHPLQCHNQCFFYDMHAPLHMKTWLTFYANTKEEKTIHYLLYTIKHVFTCTISIVVKFLLFLERFFNSHLHSPKC